jgi:pSer/pThr/pTyr-binding forkhead associated (FHA) protein
MVEDQFWQIVDTYSALRWWFAAPALLLLAGVLLALLLAAVRLQQCSRIGITCAALGLGGAVALLAPGALLAWRPFETLGLDRQALARVPTATFPAVAQAFDHTMQMSFAGGGSLVVGMLGALGVLGARRTNPCPSCGRERHPSWQQICPECQLMEPGAAEAPLMRLGDLSASGVPVTQFGGRAQTELLEAAGHTAWVEIVEGPSGVGERFAAGARLTIGRDPSQCQLVIDDEAVSARHAYIERDRQTFTIYDWGSRNGTRVNGEQVAQRALRDGDEIGIGRARLRFEAPDLAPEYAPTELLFVGVIGARLVVLDGPDDGRVFPITQLDVRIGRDRENDLVLDAPSVSRHHASVRFDGMDYYLLDAGAPNGTWLDETRVLDRARLQPGQIIRLGKQRLRFALEEVAHATKG